MLIDWFTVLAQIINFLVLVWLMKILLYKPILQAIDKREQAIADRIDAAEKAKREAGEQADRLKEKNDLFDREQESRMAAVVDEAETRRHQLLEEAAAAADTLAEQRKVLLAREARDFEQAFKKQTHDVIITVLEHILHDLAGADLEDRIAETMLKRLSHDETGEAWQQHLRQEHPGPVVVASSYKLKPDMQMAFRQSLESRFPGGAVSFHIDPELICGIQIRFSDWKLDWNIQDYLKMITKYVSSLADARASRHEQR